MNFTQDQICKFNAESRRMVESATKRKAHAEKLLDRNSRCLRGSNHVMVINGQYGDFWLKLITDSKNIIVKTEVVGSPMDATHISPQDAKRLEASKALKNGHGDVAVAQFDNDAYKSFIVDMDRIIDEYKNRDIEEWYKQFIK